MARPTLDTLLIFKVSSGRGKVSQIDLIKVLVFI